MKGDISSLAGPASARPSANPSPERGARGNSLRRAAIALGMLAALAPMLGGCAVPIVPQRTKPGGAARWAETLAGSEALRWAPDVALCRVFGAGIGTEGWLPDQGGFWQFTYWSAQESAAYEVTIDSDGKAATREVPGSPLRGHAIPADWADSPKTWAATGRHLTREPLNTFEAELAFDAEPQRYPGRCVWRVRFYLQDATFQSQVLTPQAIWLASY